MADENINEVSRKRSNGNSAGTVEVAISSAVEIGTKIGNTIEHNASEDNHAVQDMNDVVEPASESEKEGSTDEKENEKQADKKEPDTGEKRGRDDADGGLETASGEDGESVEGVEERDAKKPKTGEVEDAAGIENGGSKIDEEKDAEQEAKAPVVAADAAPPKEEQTPPKKRGPGRPKKGDKTASASPPAGGETKDSIGKRTRSKA